MCIGKSDADRTGPIIRAQQAQTDALINGTKAKLTSTEAQQVLKDRPDVLAEFNRASAAADKNSPAYIQKGLDSPENYANYWFTQMGGNKEYSFAPPPGEETKTPEQQQADVIKDTETKVDTSITDAKTATDTVVQDLKDLNTSLVGQITGMQTTFAQSQKDLLDEINRSSAEQSAAMQDAIKQMLDAQNASGQAAKKPNYARALAKNKDLNSGGLSSTMLTGPTGVASGSMSLGATSILGA